MQPTRVLNPPESKNKIEVFEDHAKVYLTRGKVALIDVADVELVSEYRWFAKKETGGGLVRWYAATTVLSSTTKTGYTKPRLHRLLLPDSQDVDHINHDGLDNCRANLRACDGTENQRNKRKQKNTSSKFKGVCWHKKEGKWRARIGKGAWYYPPGGGNRKQKQKSLGYFKDEIEAARAYDRAALELFGPYACTNVSLGLLPPEED